MVRKLRSTFVYIVGSIIFLASIYHNLLQNSASDGQFLRLPPFPLNTRPSNYLLHEERLAVRHTNPFFSSVVYPDTTPSSVSTIAVLFPAWQVLVVVLPESTPLVSDSGEFLCLFPNNDTTPAIPSGILPSPARSTFTCELPIRLRSRLPFPQPVLIQSPIVNDENNYLTAMASPAPDMLRWDFLVYEAAFTEKDVVVLVKGFNKRQGKNSDPLEFNCVFGDDVANAVRTAVTSSVQEVFRCQLPDLTDISLSSSSPVKVSLEFAADKRQVPSIAYASRVRKLAAEEPKSLLCACTMVYDVAKFLKEWVIYHSKIGVDKFILYDNASDDDFNIVVDELVKEGYNVSTIFWPWPKTQEAGFSHCAISSKDSCTWMMYADVDEFVYSVSWANFSSPSKSMLASLLQGESHDNNDPRQQQREVGEIMIGCNEFGPSYQKSNPVAGVMQGYNCRRKLENRHKSIVLLDAIHDSLLNVVHHFHLKDKYRMMKMNRRDIVINHYKYQAWAEFMTKFRRRVSAYVVDWTQNTNLHSQDRTPGLGFSAVEPEGWPEKFCEVEDNGLKELSQRWFGVRSS